MDSDWLYQLLLMLRYTCHYSTELYWLQTRKPALLLESWVLAMQQRWMRVCRSASCARHDGTAPRGSPNWYILHQPRVHGLVGQAKLVERSVYIDCDDDSGVIAQERNITFILAPYIGEGFESPCVLGVDDLQCTADLVWMEEAWKQCHDWSGCKVECAPSRW